MKKIPIGIENFKEIIDKNYYFIDKSLLIQDVIDEKIVLYTRPRRFGKTLNISMLNYFFNIKEKDNAYLFNDLAISQNQEALKHQNQYPVISLTLKEMKNDSFEKQLSMFSILIKDIIRKNEELLDSKNINKIDKETLNKYYIGTKDEVELQNALKFICSCMKQHYGQNVIILIDEYDVPLQDAYIHGYYDQMVIFLRNVFSAVLKTNDNLEKGIMTGCLRIAKESIFTGLNNFSVYSILDKKSSLRFGFIQNEVNQILDDYQMIQTKDIVKEWYDGYLFGNSEIYNPWSVLKFIHKAIYDEIEPEAFWANTSGNDVVYKYIQDGDELMKEEFEKLIQGKSIIKTIQPELTYREMDNLEYVYSFLLFTGYLKTKRKISMDIYELVIPNKEVYKIYDQSFIQYFKEYTKIRKRDFVEALKQENTEKADEILNQILRQSISYFDNYENFYHGFMVGLLQEYDVLSNREAGQGRFDIVIKPRRIREKCIIIECKKSPTVKQLVSDSEKAAKQIINKKYIEGMQDEGYPHCTTRNY